MKKSTLKYYWPVLVVIVIFFMFYSTFITLQKADLGRHIVNGRELLNGNTQLLYSNFYSYAQASQEFVNHHWFYGILVYWVEQTIGFSGLSLFNAFLNTAAFIAVLFVAMLAAQQTKQQLSEKISGLLLAISGFLSIPLFTHRLEVRPESISLLLFALFFLATESIKKKIILQKNLTNKIRTALPILILLLIFQIIWTNSHLFFIFGPLLFGYQLFSSVIQKLTNQNQITQATVLFWILTTATFFSSTLISPHGITGTLAPFQIFDSYAYRVAENQSTWFMISYGATGITKYSYTIFLSVLLSLIFFWKLIKKSYSGLHYLFLAIIFAILANVINRMLSFFGVTVIPIFYILLVQMYDWFKHKNLLDFENSITVLIYSSLGIGLSLLILFSGLFLPNLNRLGLGLLPGTANAAEFIETTNLQGPFFNNYDVGGYFTYYLYPEHLPFLDNRPEAYSPEFLENEYLASLQNESVWEEVSQKYEFNAIFFSRLDQIDGAQKFLYNHVVDEQWIPVYLDQVFILFVKNTPENQEIISEFEIPKEVFQLRE